jgi:lysine 2,3-aminomutase
MDDICRHISFNEKEKSFLKRVVKAYHMRVTPYYFSLIKDLNDQSDPIRKQCLPSTEELCEGAYEDIDPLSELKTSPLSNLVHRYPDRALFIVTSRCFMYCRHCTRKRLWKENAGEACAKDIDDAIRYIRENKKIREIIISGGDPLTLSDEKLDYILSQLSQIKHLEVIRLGTRAPVVLPSRIDDKLCAVLGKYDNLWINLQFNHPREITAQSIQACKKLQKLGIPLNNQSVLLKGVNDDPAVMKELCQALQKIRVRPYYIFQCDPVVGASHFRTSVWKGMEIIESMRGHTGGMCVPTFVIDGVDGKGKVPFMPNYLMSATEEGLNLRNYNNEVFFYPNPK